MSSDPRIGTELAGYRVESVLGRGGMSIVYLAEHLRLHRKVALKVLSPELSKDEAFRTRFIGESETAASLDHQNIIPIFEAGEADGALFIAMRYVKTTDLAVLIHGQGPLEVARSVLIVEQAASALDIAHAEGLVHRDVKPANLLISIGTGPGGTDHVYLSDFGLTKRTETTSGLTRTGSFMGTLDYVPPEQIKGQKLDGRSDQYALTCVLFQCLTGRVPFEQGDEAAILYAHLAEPPPSATALRPELPAEIDPVIARGMAKEPSNRFRTCTELAVAARAALGMPGRTAGVATVAVPTASPGEPSAPAPAAPSEETSAAVPDPTRHAHAPVEPTRLAEPPGETIAAAPPAAPTGPQPSPDGASRRRRALIIGLLAAATLAIVLLVLLLPFGTAPEEEVASSPSAVVEPSNAEALVGTWEGVTPAGNDVRLTIRKDGTLRLSDDRSVLCSPPGPIVVEEIGVFGQLVGEDKLLVLNAAVDCRGGAEDLTIPQIDIEYESETDTARMVEGTTPGTTFQRV